MNFSKAISIIFIVLALHAAGLGLDLYGSFDWYDLLMHFGGGFAAGALGLAIWREGIDEIRFKGWMAKHLKWWLVPLFVLGVVSIISIGWEVHEYLLDVWFTGTTRQLSLKDTMGDFALDLSGGLLMILLYGRTPQQNI